MSEPIIFTATVERIRTMADGGLRFEFGVGENFIMQAAELMECKRFGVALSVTAEPIVTECDDETKKGTAAGPARVGRRRIAKRRDQPSGE